MKAAVKTSFFLLLLFPLVQRALQVGEENILLPCVRTSASGLRLALNAEDASCTEKYIMGCDCLSQPVLSTQLKVYNLGCKYI